MRSILVLCALLIAVWYLRARETDTDSDTGTPDGPDRVERDPERVRVGTWNLRRLGHGKQQRMEVIARVIDQSFDVVALQEVMTHRAISELLSRLPGWRAEMPRRPVGTGKYKEFYAVLYRQDDSHRVVVERSHLLADRADAFMREPLVTCMRVRSFDFCLVDVHIVFGKRVRARDAEIRALGKTLARLRAGGREKDWILAGDFNRMPGAPGWDAVHAAGWSFTQTGRVATTLGKTGYHSAYDHILVDRHYTGELHERAHRIDIVAFAGGHGIARSRISDHAPVVASFRVTGPDDD